MVSSGMRTKPSNHSTLARLPAAYHPEVLLTLLVYGYASGTFSRRKIERATYDLPAACYLAAGSPPDHYALASFCHRFVDELAGLFL